MSSMDRIETMIEIFTEDELDFYEKYLKNLSGRELEGFLKENPEFREEYHITVQRRELLKTKIYQNILKDI